MSDTERDAQRLELLFAAARRQEPQAPAALLARVLADAEALQAQHAAVAQVEDARHRRRGTLWDSLGGWPILGGMLTAAVTGVWIGFSDFGNLSNFAAGMLGQDGGVSSVDLMPEFDVFALASGVEG